MQLPDSPIHSLKIIKSTWETQVPTGGVYGGSIGQISLGNMTPQASGDRSHKAGIEFENVKIIADNSSPLLGVIRDGTSVPYLVNGISVVGAASFTPYVKYTNTLLVPAVDLSSPMLYHRRTATLSMTPFVTLLTLGLLEIFTVTHLLNILRAVVKRPVTPGHQKIS